MADLQHDLVLLVLVVELVLFLFELLFARVALPDGSNSVIVLLDQLWVFLSQVCRLFSK